MLRSYRCVTSTIARLRVSSNVLRSRDCAYRSSPAICTSPAKFDGLAAIEILNGWPGAYRLEINNVFREISLDIEYAAVAKERYRNVLIIQISPHFEVSSNRIVLATDILMGGTGKDIFPCFAER